VQEIGDKVIELENPLHHIGDRIEDERSRSQAKRKGQIHEERISPPHAKQILPFASNRDRQTLKRICLRLKRHVGRVKHANYNVETKRFDRDM
jgi:transposase